MWNFSDSLRACVDLGLRDAACAVEDLAIIEIEEGVDQAAEVVEFIAGEVVLTDGDVARQDLAVGAACPSGQAHVGLVGLGARGDEFGGGVAVDGVVEFVLDGGEEALSGGRPCCSRRCASLGVNPRIDLSGISG